MRALFLLALSVSTLAAQPASAERTRWEKTASRVKIVRDDWGIAHVSGRTDADAVFGMIYAQGEDDFPRVEANYLTNLGRTAEAEGESKIYQDLRHRLYVNPAKLQKLYAESPAWLQKLMNAWADGLNFYLATHPETKPRVLKRFEPWMALSFTEGSIGGDIGLINLRQLAAFYGRENIADARRDALEEPSGSNGIAIAPSHTAARRALLLINPHTSFFFRSELQMTSQEGLNAYGAVTWGQFFIYQGFNSRVGWMHTSNNVDAVDEFVETITEKNGRYFYRYGNEERPVESETVDIAYQTPSGLKWRTFTVYRTHHGPIVRKTESGQWVAFRMMDEPIQALMQSYQRTKARNYAEYVRAMQLRANSSNDTIYADADGNIAFFHGNYVPKRDPRHDYTQPVAGSDPTTDWNGLHSIDELPRLFNPKNGWLYNTNNWPWSAAGADSPKRDQFPAYVEQSTENARGLHAIRVLTGRNDFTLDALLAAAYDSQLPWFDTTIPALEKAWRANPDPKLAEPVRVLTAWNRRFALDSVATALASHWAEAVTRRVFAGPRAPGTSYEGVAAAPPAVLLDALTQAIATMEKNFGTWQTPWGEVNRYQRVSPAIDHPFSDDAPSIPVAFASGNWGSLAAYGAAPYRGSKRWYGTRGNSFVAVVEFGPRVRARAVSTGGASGSPSSKHFNDQAERYATGNLREVYFYADQLKGHTEREYRPGK
jgi:acyl-homoserine lactone acylase PvdQ